MEEGACDEAIVPGRGRASWPTAPTPQTATGETCAGAARAIGVAGPCHRARGPQRATRPFTTGVTVEGTGAAPARPPAGAVRLRGRSPAGEAARHRVVASPRCGRARVEAVHLRWRARAAPSPELRARVGATPAPESRSCALVGAVPASGPRRRAGVASSPGLRARVGAARAPLEAVPRTSPGAAHGLPACAAGACPHASWGATPVSSGLEGPRPSHGEPWACAHRPPPPGVRFLTLTACSYDLAEMGRDGPFSFCWTAWAICTN
jgi:hypothetical protein